MEIRNDAVASNDIQIQDDRLIMPVDAEHSGIRAVGCVSLVVSLAVTFFVLQRVVGLSAVISLLAGIGVSVAISYGLEYMLKRTWASGRQVVADASQIALKRNDEIERELDPQQQVNVLMWYFEVTRSARVKKGWYVIGLALQQEDTYIPVYTFAPPEDFGAIPLSQYFTELKPPDDDGARDDRPLKNMKRAGEQRRLMDVERDRGMFGAEVTQAQFKHYIDFLQTRYPKWMLTD